MVNVITRGFWAMVIVCVMFLTGCSAHGPHYGTSATYVPPPNAETQRNWNAVMGRTGAEAYNASRTQVPMLSYADQQQIRSQVEYGTQHLTTGPQYDAVEQSLWQQYHAPTSTPMDQARLQYAIHELNVKRDIVTAGIHQTGETQRTMIRESHATERTLISQGQETRRVITDHVGWAFREVIRGIVDVEIYGK